MPEPVIAPPAAPAPAAAPVAPPAAPVAAVKPAAAPVAPAAGLLGAELPPEAKPADPAEPVAPVLDIKLPEGAVVNEVLMGEFKAIATEMKIPAEKAQALTDLAMKLQEQHNADINAAWQAERVAGVERLKADPDFGGAKFSQTVEAANRALRQFGDQQLIQDIQELGLDNHPGLIKAFARVARATAEDRGIDRPGGGLNSSDKTFAQRMYPDLATKA
jgi:hypothetical protein